MSFLFENLNEETRKLMLKEVSVDITNNKLSIA